MRPPHTSDDMAIARAIISIPASILRMFFDLNTVISRLDRANTTPAGSLPSYDDKWVASLEYWALVFSRSPQVFKNFSNTLVGGLIASKIYMLAKESSKILEQNAYFWTSSYKIGWTDVSRDSNAWILLHHIQTFAEPIEHRELWQETPYSGGIMPAHCIHIWRKNVICFP